MDGQEPKEPEQKTVAAAFSTARYVGLVAAAISQVPVSMLAFGYIGKWLGNAWRIPWLAAVGVFVGLILGVVGFVRLIKRVIEG